MSEVNKELIREQVNDYKSKIDKYSDYEYELKCALSYCKKAKNGLDDLIGKQYQKVKSNCDEAIGEEPDLTGLLQVKYTTMPQICTSILESLESGISGVQEKIEELKYQMQLLKNQL